VAVLAVVELVVRVAEVRALARAEVLAALAEAD